MRCGAPLRCSRRQPWGALRGWVAHRAPRRRPHQRAAGAPWQRATSRRRDRGEEFGGQILARHAHVFARRRPRRVRGPAAAAEPDIDDEDYGEPESLGLSEECQAQVKTLLSMSRRDRVNVILEMFTQIESSERETLVGGVFETLSDAEKIKLLNVLPSLIAIAPDDCDRSR